MGWKLRSALLAIATVLLLPRTAVGDAKFQQNEAYWKIRDLCAKQAHKAFPDYTRESNAKREKVRQDCLRASNLPVEEGSSVPPSTPTQPLSRPR